MKAHIEHVAIWVQDLEAMRTFYVEALGGVTGDLYQNPKTGFRSYFVSFGEGARVELMYRPSTHSRASHEASGYAHIALALGSREAVDHTVATLRDQGVPVNSKPRLTGDGYYEAVVLDPERNLVELTV